MNLKFSPILIQQLLIHKIFHKIALLTAKVMFALFRQTALHLHAPLNIFAFQKMFWLFVLANQLTRAAELLLM